MLINKNPSKLCGSDPRLFLSSFTWYRQRTVKCFGIYIDENLKWSTRIHELELELNFILLPVIDKQHKPTK